MYILYTPDIYKGLLNGTPDTVTGTEGQPPPSTGTIASTAGGPGRTQDTTVIGSRGTRQKQINQT